MKILLLLVICVTLLHTVSGQPGSGDNGPGNGGDASCDDGAQNQGENGVDCGGPLCDDCATCEEVLSETACNMAYDGCTWDDGTSSCVYVTTDASCDDNTMNQDEDGIDCGGSCDDCSSCDTILKTIVCTGSDLGCSWTNSACVDEVSETGDADQTCGELNMIQCNTSGDCSWENGSCVDASSTTTGDDDGSLIPDSPTPSGEWVTCTSCIGAGTTADTQTEVETDFVWQGGLCLNDCYPLVTGNAKCYDTLLSCNWDNCAKCIENENDAWVGGACYQSYSCANHDDGDFCSDATTGCMDIPETCTECVNAGYKWELGECVNDCTWANFITCTTTVAACESEDFLVSCDECIDAGLKYQLGQCVEECAENDNFDTCYSTSQECAGAGVFTCEGCVDGGSTWQDGTCVDTCDENGGECFIDTEGCESTSYLCTFMDDCFSCVSTVVGAGGDCKWSEVTESCVSITDSADDADLLIGAQYLCPGYEAATNCWGCMTDDGVWNADDSSCVFGYEDCSSAGLTSENCVDSAIDCDIPIEYIETCVICVNDGNVYDTETETCTSQVCTDCNVMETCYPDMPEIDTCVACVASGEVWMGDEVGCTSMCYTSGCVSTLEECEFISTIDFPSIDDIYDLDLPDLDYIGGDIDLDTDVTDLVGCDLIILGTLCESAPNCEYVDFLGNGEYECIDIDDGDAQNNGDSSALMFQLTTLLVTVACLM